MAVNRRSNMSARVLVRSILVFVLFGALAAQAQSRGQARRSGPGTGNPDDHLVPWKYLQADELAHDHPVTLYWVPKSLDQAENSPLMESQYLLDASTRCVDLEVLLPERAALLTKLNVTAPAAFIVDRQGQITRKLDKPAPKSIETLLTAELKVHDDAMYHDLLEAGRQEKAGNSAAAIGPPPLVESGPGHDRLSGHRRPAPPIRSPTARSRRPYHRSSRGCGI